MRNPGEHPSGTSPSDNGQSPEELEGSIQAFEKGRPLGPKPVENPEKQPAEPGPGPGGDSRPDRRDPGGFVAIDEDPRMTTVRDGSETIEVHKEDPEFLREHRADTEDEIVATYGGGVNAEETQVIRHRHHEDSPSEEL